MKLFSITDTFRLEDSHWASERFVFDATDERFVNADNRGGWLIEAVCVHEGGKFKLGQRQTFTLAEIESAVQTNAT